MVTGVAKETRHRVSLNRHHKQFTRSRSPRPVKVMEDDLRLLRALVVSPFAYERRWQCRQVQLPNTPTLARTCSAGMSAMDLTRRCEARRGGRMLVRLTSSSLEVVPSAGP